MANSASNKQVKCVVGLRSKVKTRREEGMYMAEGPRMRRELNPEDVDALYVMENLAGNRGNREWMERLQPGIVSGAAMNVAVDTWAPQGVLIVVKQKRYAMDNIMKPALGVRPLATMALETIQDLGGLGIITRVGGGAGVTGIVMNHITVDLYDPKVMHSIMGSVYRMPFVYTADLQDACLLTKKESVCLFAAHLKGMNNYDQEDYTDNVGFLIGDEASGLTKETVSLTDCLMKIPMEGKMEFLSTAVAASVLMFETARQRRNCRQ